MNINEMYMDKIEELASRNQELEVENEYLKSREWILENKIRELKEELRNIDIKY